MNQYKSDLKSHDLTLSGPSYTTKRATCKNAHYGEMQFTPTATDTDLT